MKKIFICLMLLMLIGSASAASTWYPRSADYNTTGDVNVANGVFSGTLAVGGVELTDTYVNETAINMSISDLTTAAYTNETAINSSIAAQAVSQVINETAINSSISALQGYVSHLSVLAGGSAGNHTLTGSAVGDSLNGVAYVAKGAENLTAVSDLTSEFAGVGKGIIDDDVIANGAGTDTSGGYLIVGWTDKTP